MIDMPVCQLRSQVEVLEMKACLWMLERLASLVLYCYERLFAFQDNKHLKGNSFSLGSAEESDGKPSFPHPHYCTLVSLLI